MRKYLLAAVAVAAFATPALARDGSPYVGIEAGLMLPNKSNYDVALSDGTTTVEYDNGLRLKQGMGYDVDAIAGYDFGAFRLEGELGWKKTGSGTPQASDDLRADTGLDNADLRALRTNTRVVSAMVNYLLDLPLTSESTLYFGGGGGRAKVRTFDDSDSALAWQLIAGLRAEMTPNVDLGIKYRYFNTGRLHYGGSETLDGVTYSADTRGKFTSHSLLASLIYNFARPVVAEAPVVVPPPPEAPVAATQTCPDGSVILATEVCPQPPAPPAPAPSGERG